MTVDADDPSRLRLRDTRTDDVGRLAAEQGITVLELTAEQGSLEQAYLELTSDGAQYRGTGPTGGSALQQVAA